MGSQEQRAAIAESVSPAVGWLCFSQDARRSLSRRSVELELGL